MKVPYKENIIIEYAYSFFPVLAVVWVLRSFLFEPFTIPSGSMLPTLEVGDYILVNKYTYGLRLPVIGTEILPIGKPVRGDVMVFKFPPKPSMNFIKRVVGLPGDKIHLRKRQLYINDVLVERKLVRKNPKLSRGNNFMTKNWVSVSIFLVKKLVATLQVKMDIYRSCWVNIL
jgi:signal peptidase I